MAKTANKQPKVTGSQLAGLSIVSGLSGSFATFQQAKASRGLGEVNTRLAEFRAEDALRRGDERIGIARGRARRIKGAQRAGFAGQGVRVDVGSAADIAAETEAISALDEMTLRNNALRESFGFKVEAINASAQADLAYLAGITKSVDTLLTSGLTAASFLD